MGELRPSKSLDTRPDGSEWMSAMDRILTPPSLDDLGEVSVGPQVPDLKAVLQDREREAFPFFVCPASRSIVLTQHRAGFRPTEAPFMFVGQRQEVQRVLAVPWAEANALAESLPEATNLGPVLFIQMTGRCGSTVLSKAIEDLQVGCQSVSEPVFLADVHEMLERGLCTKEEALTTMRAFVLMLVHQRRTAQPDKPIVVIKMRTLLTCWRACMLIPEALPEAKQIFQWRTVEDVVGSFHAGVSNSMVSATARFLSQHDLDGWLWSANGSPQARYMERQVEIMRSDPSMATVRGFEDIEAANFTKHGVLGFLTLMCMMDAHISVALGKRNLWHCTLRYEDLMEKKSACVLELLAELEWLHFVPKSAVFATPEADNVFLKDAHAGGGLAKAGGTTFGGNLAQIRAARGSEQYGSKVERENAHLPPHRAAVVRKLMGQHPVLREMAYELGLASSSRELKGMCTPKHVQETAVHGGA